MIGYGIKQRNTVLYRNVSARRHISSAWDEFQAPWWTFNCNGSVRPGAPYDDEVLEDGAVLIYEGHDHAKFRGIRDPKALDQPERYASGTLTENGKFHAAAQRHKTIGDPPDLVRVYEKIKPGIWSYNGFFHLVDSWTQSDGYRDVFKFRLEAIEEVIDAKASVDVSFGESKRRRIIPSQIKLEVWKRDEGKCTKCGAQDELHFDHILPFSKGVTSLKTENVQILCARHNLQKSANIE